MTHPNPARLLPTRSRFTCLSLLIQVRCSQLQLPNVPLYANSNTLFIDIYADNTTDRFWHRLANCNYLDNS